MKESVLERIKIILKEKSKSKNDFAVKLSMGQVTVNNYIEGKRAISLDFVLNILTTFPDISSDWLLRGTGTMYQQATADVTINGPQSIKGNNNITNSRHIQVPSSHNDDIIQLLRQQVEQQSQQIKSLNDLVRTLVNK